MSDAYNEAIGDELFGILCRMCHILGLQEEDIESPVPGSIFLGKTGVSVLRRSKPSVSWEVREEFIAVDASGERSRVSRLIATIPEKETVRVAQVSFILAFERSLDIEIASLNIA